MKIALTQEELSELRQVQRNVTGTAYIKATGILLLSGGLSLRTVSESLGMDVSTVYCYAALYSGGGLTALTANRHKGYRGMLSSYETSLLRTELKRNVYADSKGICSWIKDSFGVSYTPERGVDLLNRIGFTYKKTKDVPCESSTEKQEALVSELSEIIVGMNETSIIYYADGVHPTHSSRSTYAWTEKGQEMEQPTVSGRDRVNINGHLNAAGVTDVIVHEYESVNAESTKALFIMLP